MVLELQYMTNLQIWIPHVSTGDRRDKKVRKDNKNIKSRRFKKKHEWTSIKRNMRTNKKKTTNVIWQLMPIVFLIQLCSTWLSTTDKEMYRWRHWPSSRLNQSWHLFSVMKVYLQLCTCRKEGEMVNIILSSPGFHIHHWGGGHKSKKDFVVEYSKIIYCTMCIICTIIFYIIICTIKCTMGPLHHLRTTWKVVALWTKCGLSDPQI